jgi:2-polyprenyl-6-methoxyphenol hydroxylase-like FAD-dependent oxidoreductase
MLSVELARRGVPVRLVEQATDPSTASKGLAVMGNTLKLLEPSGLTEAFLDGALRPRGVNAYSGGRRLARIGFEKALTRRHAMVMLPQYRTERLLAAKAADLGVRIDRGTEVLDVTLNPTGGTVVMRSAAGTERVEADWVVGCDGSHSRVRASCGIKFRGAMFPERAISTDAFIENAPTSQEIHVFFCDQGFVGMFPMPDGRWRVSLNLDEPNTPRPEPTFEQVRKMVTERLGRDLKMSDPSWISDYQTHLRMAATMKRGRCVLAGDAAHIHNPTGARGMNRGIADAAALAEALAAALDVGSETPVERWARRRRREAYKVVTGTTAAYLFLESHSRWVRGIRDRVLSTVGPVVDRRTGAPPGQPGLNAQPI